MYQATLLRMRALSGPLKTCLNPGASLPLTTHAFYTYYLLSHPSYFRKNKANSRAD